MHASALPFCRFQCLLQAANSHGVAAFACPFCAGWQFQGVLVDQTTHLTGNGLLFSPQQMPNRWDLGIHQQYCGQIANVEFPELLHSCSWPIRLNTLITSSICLIFCYFQVVIDTQKIPTRPWPTIPLAPRYSRRPGPPSTLGGPTPPPPPPTTWSPVRPGPPPGTWRPPGPPGPPGPPSQTLPPRTSDKISSVRRAERSRDVCDDSEFTQLTLIQYDRLF